MIINIGASIDPGVGYGTYPVGINQSGQVAGYVHLANSATGTFLYSGGTTTVLDAPNFTPAGMNDLGDIVGAVFAVETGYTADHAALYRDGTVYDLGTLPGVDTASNDYSVATAVNNDGDVTGISNTTNLDGNGDPEEHAFLYSNGVMTDLGTVPGGLNSTGQAINNHGQVVGKVRTSTGSDQACYFSSGGGVTDFSSKFGSDLYSSVATAINGSGQIAGTVIRGDFTSFGYLDTAGTIKNLGAIEAEGINSQGDVAGSTLDAEGNSVALVYLSGILYDLATVVEPGQMGDFVSLDDASAINDDGLIAGYGTLASGEQDAFLAIPSVGLAGTHDGLASVAGVNVGYFNIYIRSTDAFTAMLKTPEHSYSFSGMFPASGAFAGTIKLSRTVTLTVSLQRNLAAGTVSGTISDGVTTYAVLAKEYAAYSAKSPAPQTGKYTVILPPATGLPQGGGWATLNVSAAGVASFSGKLGDEAPISLEMHLHKDGTIAFYHELYAGPHPGGIVGEVTFETETDSDCDAMLQWSKPAQVNAKLPYSAGFNAKVPLSGAKFTAPALAVGNYALKISGAGLATTLQHTINLMSHGAAVVTDPSADKLALKIDLKTGTYSGSFIVPGEKSRTSFTGIVYQAALANSGGVFLGSANAGAGIVAFP